MKQNFNVLKILKNVVHVPVLNVIFISFFVTQLGFALDSKYKPDTLSSETSGSHSSQSVFKMGLKESKVLIFTRDAGFGVGAGALAGASFIGLTQGRFPNTANGFDREALLSGALAGLMGGAFIGFIHSKWADGDGGGTVHFSLVPGNGVGQNSF